MIEQKNHDHRLAHMIGMRTRRAPERIDRSTTKKPWDAFQGDLRERPLTGFDDVAMAPSTRYERRMRARGSAAAARKSRKKAFRLAHEERQNDENLRGMARVHLGLVPCSEGMDRNVTLAVWSFAEKLAEEAKVGADEKLVEIDEMLRDIAKAYGDDLDTTPA